MSHHPARSSLDYHSDLVRHLMSLNGCAARLPFSRVRAMGPDLAPQHDAYLSMSARRGPAMSPQEHDADDASEPVRKQYYLLLP